MDVSFVIDQQSVSFLVAQITNIGGLVTITDNNLVFVGTVAGDDLQVIAKNTNLTILSPTYTLLGNVLTLSNIPTGTNATVKNSDNTFTQNIAAGATYTLDNTTFAIYLDGVLSNTTILPSMVAQTLNIILT